MHLDLDFFKRINLTFMFNFFNISRLSDLIIN